MGDEKLEVKRSLFTLNIEAGAIPADKLDDILLFFGIGGLALGFLFAGQVEVAATIAKGLSGAIFMYVKGK